MAQFRTQICHLWKYVVTTCTATFPPGISIFLFRLTNLYTENAQIQFHCTSTWLFCRHGKLPTCGTPRYKLLRRQIMWRNMSRGRKSRFMEAFRQSFIRSNFNPCTYQAPRFSDRVFIKHSGCGLTFFPPVRSYGTKGACSIASDCGINIAFMGFTTEPLSSILRTP